MIRVSKTALIVFLAGFSLIAVGQSLQSDFAGNLALVVGSILCIGSIWREHSVSDEVARRFAYNAFTAGFTAMAACSIAREDIVSLPPSWIVGFVVFLVVYAVQLARSIW